MPDPLHVVPPALHVAFSCRPVGIVVHLAEIAWHGTRGERGRRAVPLLHLLCSCAPLGLAQHVGELTWALAPFVFRPQL